MARVMKDSGIEWIGQIPKEWCTPKLLYVLRSKICDVPHATPNYVDAGIPSISIDSLNDTKRIDLTNVKRFITEEAYMEFCKKTIIEKGDILFSKAATIGKTAIVGDEVFMVWSPLAVLKRDEKKIDNDYLYYLLNCNYLIDAIALSGSLNTQINVGMREMEQARIPLPLRNEQQKIATFLDEKCASIDAVIEKTKASIEEYKKLKHAIITQAVTKGVRGNRKMKPTGFQWLKEIPEDGTMERGKGLFYEINSKSDNGEEELLTVSQYTGVTPRSQKSVNMFEAETLEGYKICDVGDIAANTMWLWAGAIGVSEYYGVISPSYNIYRQKSNAYNSKYLDYLLRISPIVQLFESMSTGIRASRLRLYPQQFLSIYFPMPSIKEQEEIVSYLEKKAIEVDKLIQKKEQFLKELEIYKDSLVYEYVTGKKEVV